MIDSSAKTKKPSPVDGVKLDMSCTCPLTAACPRTQNLPHPVTHFKPHHRKLTIFGSHSDTACAFTPQKADAQTDTSAVTSTSAGSAPSDTPYTLGATVSPTTHQPQEPPTKVRLVPLTHPAKPHDPLPTPIHPGRLASQLTKSGYPPDDITYLVSGFKNGFMLGHEGRVTPVPPKNSQRAETHPLVVTQKIEKELAAGRLAGPFQTPPFDNFRSSPLSVREKKEPGEFRLVHDLSHPHDGSSVNSNIPLDNKSVKYASLQNAIALVQKCGKGAFMAKSDIKSAFRLIPVNPAEYHKLGMYWNGTYFYDKCLPFGLGSSCQIFERFSSALEHIFKSHFPTANCIHYLDDFFFVAPSWDLCNAHLEGFLTLCSSLGIPIAQEKTFTPRTTLTFLGIEIDSIMGQVRLPMDKVADLQSTIMALLESNKTTRSTLESLHGKLNFATRVLPGRAFNRRLINLFISLEKPYYKVRLSRAIKYDLEIWHLFLKHFNGVTLFRSPLTAHPGTLNLVTDASKIGYGGVFGSHWIQGRWPEDWQSMNIAVQEIFPIFLILAIFGKKMANHHVILLCDNEAVTEVINNQTSKCKFLMTIVRKMITIFLCNNIKFRAQHIAGKTNLTADALSRFQIEPHDISRLGLASSKTAVPPYLLPENFTWQC